MVRIRFRSRRNQSQQRRICCYARKRYVIKAQMKQNWHISIVAWILSNHINEKSSYTSIKVSMDYLKLQLKSIKNMNISKNLIIFTITKIPPSNLPNKSKREFLLNLKTKNYKLHQALQKLSTMKRFCTSPNLIKILPTL